METLRESLKPGDGFLVTSRENVQYLSGFTGTAGTVLITPDRAVFLTDFRYLTQSEEQVTGMERKIYARQMEALEETVKSCKISRLRFEANSVFYGSYEQLQETLKDVVLEPTKDVVEEFRHRKDDEEMDVIRQAVALTARAWKETLTGTLEGSTEREVAIDLEFRLKRAGSEAAPFDFIVASGPRGALPHGVASDRKILRGELVTFDFGACVGGYFSDLTRTVALGELVGEMRVIYDTVLEANRAGIESVRPGAKAGEVDAAARSIIEKAGYGDRFGHGTGHGLGMEIHENLRIAKGQERELLPGMVLTVEPGIYIPDLGGVRIEDMVRVTENGVEVLTADISKEWTVLK